MGEQHGGQATAFRRWLIEKLKQTRWVVRGNEAVEHTAKRLGVQPDVLEQAQRELDAEAKKAGRLPVELGTRKRRANQAAKWIDLDFPEEVYRDWQMFCRERQTLSPTAMLRSAVHTLLSGPDRPTWTGRGWFYRGRRLLMEGYQGYVQRGKRWPYHARCDVTHGALTALMWRAEEYGTNVTALVRGAVIDLLEGRTQRLMVCQGMVAMFDDPYRYWVPPGKRPEAHPQRKADDDDRA